MTSLSSLNGKAYVNVCKGKMIPGYEISLTPNWQGEAKDSQGTSLLKVDDTIKIPYIFDENADEDPKSMTKGGPVKDEYKPKKVVRSLSSSPLTMTTTTTMTTKTTTTPKKKEKEKNGRKSISMMERFNCRAKDFYEILMDENRWKGFTQSNARNIKEVGGEFSIFDGSMTGTNLELQEAKLIVQRWRFGSWNDGVQSTCDNVIICVVHLQVRLMFEEPDELVLLPYVQSVSTKLLFLENLPNGSAMSKKMVSWSKCVPSCWISHDWRILLVMRIVRDGTSCGYVTKITLCPLSEINSDGSVS
ncbi:hypothetical protein JHK82_024535 [Glycine max]|nr:hypothetical protein JHK85_025134 [Glycine max]KAG5012372.1 hypothetical protein JHK86_024633 [Glycine max]KAG5133347.1 hypothetical protein JHK82_024535 [Glycine max]